MTMEDKDLQAKYATVTRAIETAARVLNELRFLGYNTVESAMLIASMAQILRARPDWNQEAFDLVAPIMEKLTREAMQVAQEINTVQNPTAKA